MSEYTKTYRKLNLKFYNNELASIKELFKKNENIALASSLCAGDERFIEFLYESLRVENDYQIMILRNELQSVEELISNVQMSKTQTILLVPYFYKNIEYYSNILNILYRTFKNNEVLVLVKLAWDFHLEPARYTDISQYLTNIIIRQPLDSNGVEEQIKLRSELHNWKLENINSKEVYKLSGGLQRLVKRILKFYNDNSSLDLNKLIDNPAVTLLLEDLSDMYNSLSKSKLESLGIIDEKGECKSGLLNEYIKKNRIAPKKELTGTQKELFNLLYQNRNKLVTDQMIDLIIRKGKSGTLWANYKLVARLRIALGDKYNIRTVKGKGYVLSEKN